MADVFFSYKRENRDRVEPLVRQLEAAGFEIWWDPNVTPGERFADVIDDQLERAKCVVVAWSRESIRSAWVCDEAAVGRERGILVPLSLDGTKPPLGFRAFQTPNFQDWTGDGADPRIRQLVGGVRRVVGSATASNPLPADGHLGTQPKAGDQHSNITPSPSPSDGTQAAEDGTVSATTKDVRQRTSQDTELTVPARGTTPSPDAPSQRDEPIAEAKDEGGATAPPARPEVRSHVEQPRSSNSSPRSTGSTEVPSWLSTNSRGVLAKRDVQKDEPSSGKRLAPKDTPAPAKLHPRPVHKSDEPRAKPPVSKPGSVARPPRRWPIALVASIAAVIVLALGVVAYLVGERTQPGNVAAGPPSQAQKDAAPVKPKIDDRVEPSPQQAPAKQQPQPGPAPQMPQTQAPPKQAQPPAKSPVPAVAQRVVLYEEDPNDPLGKRYIGSAIWRTETTAAGPNAAPDLAVRADLEIPERRITTTFSLRRNSDPAMPASHTVEVMFNLPADFPFGGVSNVPGIIMKEGEQTRGTPLAGLAVKVTSGYFLVGLSAVESDLKQNLKLMKERPWLDIPLVYNNGRRAILAIEKGTPGQRAFEEAFKAWGQ